MNIWCVAADIWPPMRPSGPTSSRPSDTVRRMSSVSWRAASATRSDARSLRTNLKTMNTKLSSASTMAATWMVRIMRVLVPAASSTARARSSLCPMRRMLRATALVAAMAVSSALGSWAAMTGAMAACSGCHSRSSLCHSSRSACGSMPNRRNSASAAIDALSAANPSLKPAVPWLSWAMLVWMGRPSRCSVCSVSRDLVICCVSMRSSPAVLMRLASRSSWMDAKKLKNRIPRSSTMNKRMASSRSRYFPKPSEVFMV